jgi:16S rRNA (guanine966-N2)-methyltransferase
VLAGAPDRPYDVVLVDPPYELPDAEIAGWLRAAEAGGWLSDDVVVVVERAARSGDFGWPEPLAAIRSRRYGDTVLHVGGRARADWEHAD